MIRHIRSGLAASRFGRVLGKTAAIGKNMDAAKDGGRAHGPDDGAVFVVSYEKHSFSVRPPPDRDFILEKMQRTRKFYEADLLSYLHRTVRRAGTVIDCGANIGNHTLFFSGVLGRNTIAIEPIARNRALLNDMLALNGLSEMVRIVPFAIGAEAGQARMATPNAGNPGMFRVVSETGQGELVQMTTLDSLLSGEDTDIALIKFDLEGFEEPALRGALQTVERMRPMIVAELTSTEQFAGFYKHLKELGYSATHVFCATPSVTFEVTGAGAVISPAVVRQLAAYEQKQRGRV